MGHIDYSYTYSSGDPFVYQSPSSSSSMVLPSDLPDLYYEYEMATPPSASSSELIYTPPQVGQTTALPWESVASDNAATISFAQPLTLPPSPSNIAMQQRPCGTLAPINKNFDSTFYQFSAMDPTQTPAVFAARNDTVELRKPVSYPQGLLLTQPLTNSTTSCVSPAALFANPSISIAPTPSISHTPLKLHQPRPSRKISIVSLDQLASACETPGVQTVKPGYHDHPAFVKMEPQWCGQVPIQDSSPIKGPYWSNQLDSNHCSGMTSQGIERIILCPCGCMESYSFLL